MAITGSCLCGSVGYEINGRLLDACHCHCSMCRKAHGAAYATYASLQPETFRWTSGEEFVTRYDSSPTMSRVFCSVCGSKLAVTEDGQISAITLGTVAGDPGIRPRSHIFTGSKAPWHEISDALLRFEEWPPGEGWA